MTAFTPIAKFSVVNVVFHVTTAAFRRQRNILAYRSLVTGIASQTLVAAIEHETGLAIVVE